MLYRYQAGLVCSSADLAKCSVCSSTCSGLNNSGCESDEAVLLLDDVLLAPFVLPFLMVTDA